VRGRVEQGKAREGFVDQKASLGFVIGERITRFGELHFVFCIELYDSGLNKMHMILEFR